MAHLLSRLVALPDNRSRLNAVLLCLTCKKLMVYFRSVATRLKELDGVDIGQIDSAQVWTRFPRAKLLQERECSIASGIAQCLQRVVQD